MHQTELDDWIGSAVARCVETLLPNHALALIDALSAVASLAIEGVTGLYATTGLLPAGLLAGRREGLVNAGFMLLQPSWPGTTLADHQPYSKSGI